MQEYFKLQITSVTAFKNVLFVVEMLWSKFAELVN